MCPPTWSGARGPRAQRLLSRWPPTRALDGDSSSDYVNNTSEEEDYDEGLPGRGGGHHLLHPLLP